MRYLMYFLVVCFPLIPFCGYPQEKDTLKQISFAFISGSGAIIPEYSNALYTTEEFSQLVSFEIARRNFLDKDFEALYNFPELGILAQYQTLGNKTVNGVEFSLVPFTRIHFFEGKRSQFMTQFGFGLSYVSRSYDPLKNPLNVAIGSKLNAHFQTKVLGDFVLSRQFNLLFGLSFDHLSNANLSEPNLGINTLSAFVGLQFGKTNLKRFGKIGTTKLLPKERFQLLPNLGGKHTRALAEKFYFVSTFTADWYFHVNKRFCFSAGPDFFYDSSIPIELKAKNKIFRSIDYFQTGIHINPLLRYKQFVYGLSIGAYLGLTDKVSNKPIFSRLFIEYHFSKYLFLRIAMKSHLHILEYPEVGIGIKWAKE
jgi:hypothetical protein